MKRITLATLTLFLFCASLTAQTRKVQNRPYTDLRYFHFGIHVGTHLQDLEFQNAGPIEITDENGNTETSFITCDQDRYDPGFNVGVLGELRLNEYLQLRIAPAIYFGSRHFIFHNMNSNATDVEHVQDLKTAYVTTTADLIFAAPRCNNHRLYVMAGVTPALNITSKSTDIVKLKGFQNFVELGFGFDEYLPFFKCRPELKFMFGLGNSLDTKHPDELKDKTSIAYARSVNSAKTKMITLSFYFE